MSRASGVAYQVTNNNRKENGEIAMNQMELSEKILFTALSAWNLSPPLTIKHLASGFTSDVWCVETGNGRFVAKYTEQPQEAFEKGLYAAGVFEQEGIPSGAPLPTRNSALSILVEGVHGKSQPLALLRYVPGDLLQFSEPGAASLYGHLLGHTHRFLRNRFSENDFFGLNEFLLREDEYVTAQPDVASLIHQTLEKMRAYEAQHTITYGVIWADRMEIVCEKETGQVGIIDWGAMGWGPLVFDVALSLLRLFPEGSEASHEFLQAYLAESPISVQELQGLPYYQALFWARQAKYFAYRLAASVTLGDASPEGNTRHFMEARQHLEHLLARL